MALIKRTSVLVIDDDAGVVDYLAEMLRARQYDVRGVSDPQQGLQLAREGAFDLVLSDVEMPGLRGLDLMTALQATRTDQLVVLMTAFGSIDLAVQAMRHGAADFIAKPFKIEELYAVIERVLTDRRARREIVRLRTTDAASAPGTIVARSPAMQRVLALAQRAAQTDSTVLLTGESGSGKGALARYIHDASRRSAGPFVQVNCGALPAALIESELFGVRKGAFTDAKENRSGLFVEATGGTLFLDEIGELPLEAQPKLLQALDAGSIRAVGATTETAVDVRVIAATNRPLEEQVKEKLFRADLYYRLNVIRADLPALRNRTEDIGPLAELFLRRASDKLQRSIAGVSAEGMRWLTHYGWPGNARELANIIERAVALTDHDTVVLEDLAHAISDGSGNDFLATAAAQQRPLEEVERAYIRMVLDSVEGNKTKAARILQIDRRTLYRKLFGEDGEDNEG